MKKSQATRILDVLKEAKGDWVSAKVFKRDMWISECNARISELRNKGYNIETGEYDSFGFALHRLEPIKETINEKNTTKVNQGDGSRPFLPEVLHNRTNEERNQDRVASQLNLWRTAS